MPNLHIASGYTCQEVARKATEFLEDRLPTASRDATARHLQNCNACRVYMQQLVLVRDSLRRLRTTPVVLARQA
jgi:anti-sigma factor RsiW